MLQKFLNNTHAYGQVENLAGTDLSSTIPPELNNIIESEPAIIPEDSSTSGSEIDEQGLQQQGELSNTFSTDEINPSESISSSNPGEQLSTNDHSNTTSLTDSFANPFSFDIENYIDDLIVIIIVLLSSVSIYFIIHYVLKRSADSLKIKERRIKGIDSLLKTMLIVISAIIILFQFSTISATVAGFISIGVGSVIGFSSRNTISNAIAGLILLSSRPFKLGDRIQAGNMEVVGDVIEIALIYTKIKTIRNEMITIPNQVLLQNQITNYSGYKFLAISIQVSAGYNEDQENVKYLLLEAAKNTFGVLKEPKPYVLFKELGDFAAIYDLIAYTDRANLSIQIKSDLRANVYNLFKESKIDLTTPRIVDSYKIYDTTSEDDQSTF
ncbi:MAG: mechanosensitive ion channel family protein [Nitrososphaeraceae archaeon]|nr:mechanosensitive ion channel family protein [Nitrososphaeraceae archaeon]